MKIGLDFGTMFTKIAYVSSNDEPELFEWNEGDVRKHVPTAIVYRPEGMTIGQEARSEVLNHRPGLQYAEAFKMCLPLPGPPEWQARGWSCTKPPAEVTADYLRHLLLGSDCSLVRANGPLERVVAAVPEAWHRDDENLGVRRYRQILAETLGLPVRCLVSEPVCAAAYLVHRYRTAERKSTDGAALVRTWLICDAGGGTVDVALCAVDDSRDGNTVVRVLGFEGGDGSGLGPAGYAFDRAAVSAAYEARHGMPPDVGGLHFARLLRTFEDAKSRQRVRASRVLKAFIRDHDYRDAAVYQFDMDGVTYSLTAAEAHRCFSPIDDVIRATLQRIINESGGLLDKSNKNWRVAIIGGFGQFYPVEHAVRGALDLEDKDIHLESARLTDADPMAAVAYGAALIANDVIRLPVEYYPHALGVRVRYIDGGELKGARLPLVRPNELEIGGELRLARNGAEPIPVQVVPGPAGRALSVDVQVRGVGDWGSLDLPNAAYPPPGNYYVGIRVNCNKMGSLVFRPIGGGEDIIYALGETGIRLLEGRTA